MADAYSDLTRLWEGGGEESYDGQNQDITEQFLTPENKWSSRVVYKNFLLGHAHPDTVHSDLICTRVSISPYGVNTTAGGPSQAKFTAAYEEQPTSDITAWKVHWTMGGDAITLAGGGWVWSDTLKIVSDVQGVKLFPKTTYTFTGRVYKASIIQSDLEDAVGKVNSDTWFSKDPGTMLFLGMEAEEKVGASGNDLLDATLNFAYKPSTWNKAWRQNGKKGFENILHVIDHGNCTAITGDATINSSSGGPWTDAEHNGKIIFISDASGRYFEGVVSDVKGDFQLEMTANSTVDLDNAPYRIIDNADATEGPYDYTAFADIFG